MTATHHIGFMLSLAFTVGMAFPVIGLFHLAAWSQSIDPAGVFAQLNAVQDTQITVALKNVQVPALNQIVALAAGVETTVAQQARLTAPSRRVKALQRIAPTQGNAAAASLPGDPQKVIDLRDTPLKMVVGEQMQAEILSDPAAVQIQWLLAWLADGPIAPILGDEFTIRADGTTALVAQTWTLVPIVFAENLPRGRYRIVGFRAQSTNLVAARLVIIGSTWRPGALGCNTDRHLEHLMFRHGELGSWGEFEDTDLVQVECLATAADAAEIFYLDLIQVREGPGA